MPNNISIHSEVYEEGNRFEFMLQQNGQLFISQGNGVCVRNAQSIPFTAGDLFLLNRSDTIQLECEERSTVFLLEFTDEIKMMLKELIRNSGGKAIPPIRAKSAMHPKINCNQNDLLTLLRIYTLLSDLQNHSFYNRNLMLYQMLCILSIAERNLLLQPTRQEKGIPVLAIQPMIRHIHKNLQFPELLSLNFLAQKFNLTKNRLGFFFKNEMGITVKQYVLNCRMEAVEKKISQSQQSLSEIANEFGFTDESHFNKSFRKQFGINPSEYRNLKLN
ncbi:helix-turn-helix domain-containing protein [Robertkochia solimangrovi]|uniref:helix-turn-helix domain-containing protein n=1 Tax=Robertkochia solimangrovi TaxID=2213046 RepID=UPI00117F52AB|nr:AraC family transcriptional regulator [Robertkochia solimangrovi]TRZ41964.1 hypothetical protein DMZ48_15105 [Robertkochia solimangrovi]